MLNVKIKRLSNTAILPTYGSEKAAGIDLYADLKGEDSIAIANGMTKKIGCGFAFQPPAGYVGLIFARSGIATKKNLRPANCVGVCDEDYTGEYIIPLHNDHPYNGRYDLCEYVKHGDRIAQLMFIPYEQANLIEVDELDATDRADGGFGSSGV
jgi:dUTP pyrophosphatase